MVSKLHEDGTDFSGHAAADGNVTLMFSDMEGFTEMTERLGDREAHRVIRTHNGIVREQLAAHGGTEVELQGDGFLLAFASAGSALRCALAIQQAFAAYNAASPDEPIRVRIGLHTGQAIKEADRFFGRTVILAARIADAARGGEIMVSSALRQAVARDESFRFGDQREARLKGFSDTQSLFPLRWE